jgi:agmatine/peptidylarginine deiminase
MNLRKTMLPIILLAFFFVLHSNAQEKSKTVDWKKMHMLSPDELNRMNEAGKDFYETAPPVGPIKNVAEFDQMEGVLIAYPYGGFGIPTDLIAEMAEDVVVTTIVANASQENTVRSIYETAGVNLDNCNFLYAPVDSYWSRDYSPWYVVDGNNDVGIINFPYNRPRPNDNDIPIETAEFIDVELFGMNLIHTGGNYMCDGYGIAASTDLVIEENPGMSESQIEEKVEDYLGIHTYHMTEDPLDDYIEHIDCWGKFLDVDKILIGAVPESDYRYQDFEDMANYWASQVSSYGTYYQVFRTHSPQGQPYTNSLILNKKVFVPIVTGYGSQWNDSALAVYEQAMPGYEVIGFDEYSNAPWYSTDALHCRTHGIADRNMLIIKHIPIRHQVKGKEDLEIEAQIIACSDTTLVADSLIVYYAINDGAYQAITMTQKEDSTYHAYIPEPEIGSTLKYYLFAKDNKGNAATHPFIGAADAHEFIIQEINSIPEFVSTPDSMAIVGEAYAYNISVVDENGNEGLVIGFVSLPFWVSLSDNGNGSATLSGTPEQANIGSFMVKIYATDGIDTVYQSFNLQVSPIANVFSMSVVEARIYPNPISDLAFVRLNLKADQNLTVHIYDLYGKHIESLFVGDLEDGKQLIRLDLSKLENGIYIARMQFDHQEIVRKLVKSN